jgi:hypothetical protein
MEVAGQAFVDGKVIAVLVPCNSFILLLGCMNPGIRTLGCVPITL